MKSRKIVGYEISNTMDENMCTAALERAIKEDGVPEIIQTDRGSKYMRRAFQRLLEMKIFHIPLKTSIKYIYME